MPKKIPIALILTILFLNPAIIYAKGYKYAEIFDPRQDKVVRVVRLNAEIRSLVSGLAENMEYIRGKHNPVIVDDEYMMKVSLEPKVSIRRRWLKNNMNRVYIVFPKKGSPFFMYFKTEDKISCFPFNGDMEALTETLASD